MRESVRSAALAAASVAFVLAASWLAACTSEPYQCTQHVQCGAAGMGGFCESVGYCSFPDATCPSGRRYSEYSGKLANLCAPAHDDGVADAGGATETNGDSVGTVGAAEGESSTAVDLSTTGGGSGNDLMCSWWDVAWTHRVPIEPMMSTNGETLTDFPVLVTLNPTRFDFGAAAANGSDLRFVRASDELELSYEVEDYGAELAQVWVAWPELQGPDDSVLLYFGNAAAVAMSDAESVWGEQYALVTHMQAAPQDACGTSAVSSVKTSSGAGLFGTAHEFFDDDGYVTAGKGPPVDNVFASGGMISAWIKPEEWGTADWGRIADKSQGVGGERGYSFQLSNHNAGRTIELRRDTNPIVFWQAPSDSITLDQWQWVAVSFNDSTVDVDPVIWIDGQPQPVQRFGSPNDNVDSDVANELWIGNRQDLRGRTFDGWIDEVRVSRVLRSTTWMRFQYASMTDALLDYGAVEPRPPECEGIE